METNLLITFVLPRDFMSVSAPGLMNIWSNDKHEKHGFVVPGG